MSLRLEKVSLRNRSLFIDTRSRSIPNIFFPYRELFTLYRFSNAVIRLRNSSHSLIFYETLVVFLIIFGDRRWRNLFGSLRGLLFALQTTELVFFFLQRKLSNLSFICFIINYIRLPIKFIVCGLSHRLTSLKELFFLPNFYSHPFSRLLGISRLL